MSPRNERTYYTICGLASMAALAIGGWYGITWLWACGLLSGLSILLLVALEDMTTRERSKPKPRRDLIELCPKCRGLGKDERTLLPCSRCHGTGYVKTGVL